MTVISTFFDVPGVTDSGSQSLVQRVKNYLQHLGFKDIIGLRVQHRTWSFSYDCSFVEDGGDAFVTVNVDELHKFEAINDDDIWE